MMASIEDFEDFLRSFSCDKKVRFAVYAQTGDIIWIGPERRFLHECLGDKAVSRINSATVRRFNEGVVYHGQTCLIHEEIARKCKRELTYQGEKMS